MIFDEVTVVNYDQNWQHMIGLGIKVIGEGSDGPKAGKFKLGEFFNPYLISHNILGSREEFGEFLPDEILGSSRTTHRSGT